MAIVSLGAIVVPINFQLSMRETAFILKNADSHFLLTDKPLTLDAAINSQYYEDVKQMDIGTCIEPTTLPPPPELPKDFRSTTRRAQPASRRALCCPTGILS